MVNFNVKLNRLFYRSWQILFSQPDSIVKKFNLLLKIIRNETKKKYISKISKWHLKNDIVNKNNKLSKLRCLMIYKKNDYFKEL